MIKVTVEIAQVMAVRMNSGGGQKKLLRVVALPPDSTVRSLLQTLGSDFGPEFKHIYDRDRDILNAVVAINGIAGRSKKKLDTVLNDGDRVVFLAALGGG